MGHRRFEDVFDKALDALPDRPRWVVYDSIHEEDQIDGVHVLARASGPFFVVDGRSQNNRFYSRQLWEKVIKDTGVQDRLKRRKVLGTIGHDQEIDDKALREGKLSHVLTKIWIDEGKEIGMGEIYVLNTDTGRRLNTYLRSGIELPVSSRAYGKYRGKTRDGAQIVDESTYKFETFDFVQLPGITHAVPKLIESDLTEIDETEGDQELEVVSSEARTDSDPDEVSSDMDLNTPHIREEDEDSPNIPATLPQSTDSKVEDDWMDASVLTKLTEDKVRIETDLSRVMEERTQLTEQVSLLRSQVSMLTKQVQQYETFGTVEEITEWGQTAEKPRRGGGLPQHGCSVQWSRGPLRAVPEDAFRLEAFREKNTLTRKCEREDYEYGHLEMNVWLVSNTRATLALCETVSSLRMYRLRTVTVRVSRTSLETRGRP